ncbi:MAG TPA: hypothetical protein VGY66_01215 [Gemmataceae bacterium]|jgi:hypothetical protein|nr:hypothetical protein [Gemmataceae bacterium]
MAKNKTNGEDGNGDKNGGAAKKMDLVCKTFSLELYQKWPKKPTSFRLQVTDSNDDSYILSPTTIPSKADLIALLLRRIATAKGQPGWKFDADDEGFIIG